MAKKSADNAIGAGVDVAGIGRLMGLPTEISGASGTIGIISGDLARFSDFTVCLLALIRPVDARIAWMRGMDVTANSNRIVEAMAGDWLWLMGDDHVFNPDLLMNLLALELDVVVPLCLKKNAPFQPVIYGSEEVKEDGLTYYYQAELPQQGVVEIHAAGSAGMLIRRHVLDALPRPVFETTHGMQNDDLILCRKIREAGFKIHCAIDERLGHLGVFGVYPFWQGDRFGTVLDLGNGQYTPLFAVDSDGTGEAEQPIAEVKR